MNIGFGLAVAVLAQAQQEPSLIGEEARHAGAPIVEQFLAEAERTWYGADSDGSARFVLWTRGRASDEDGICRREEVVIQTARSGEAAAAPPGEPARIREVEAKPQFHVLRTDADEPRWDVSGDALERACADPGESTYDWFDAASSDDARAAVLGLLAVERELARPESQLIEVRCGEPRRCFDRAVMVSLIRPLAAGSVYGPDALGCRVARGRRCQRFSVYDQRICGGWQLEVESDGNEPFRLLRARFTERANTLIHCNGEES